ncbi:12433_t:CDS:2 [Funneliformis caledonium]|uniref:12433_t:CDS:1 n=1 Tax=Funneliformis caledonium TaxID=1117310 RepID=A0A9N8ZBY0_9GLOM|nr:12433_t:CDS:2 [Funneliformis caledonium]
MSEYNEKDAQTSYKRSKDRANSRNSTMTDSNKSDLSRKCNKNLRKTSFSSISRVSSIISVDHLPRNARHRVLNNNDDDYEHSHTLDDNSSEDEENDDLQDNLDPYKVLNRKEDSLRTPFQLKCYYFFEEPITKWGRAFVIFSSTCTIVVVLMICINSWPTISVPRPKIYREIWIPIDLISLITFTIEYLGRFYASINKWKFFYQPMNLIDLISIIPFFIHLIFLNGIQQSMLQVIRVLRLFRLLGLFRVAKYSTGFYITAKVFQRSAYQIVVVSVYFLVILLTSSALIFYIERGEFDQRNLTWYRIGNDGNYEISPFQSIIHSLWWSIVTLTTTGYGDAVPVTGLGKFVAAVTMTCGILVIALPTSIIGSNFNAEWSFHRRLQFQMRVHKTREQAKSFIEIGENKTKKIKVLQNQNKAMLEGLAEIQERLSEINPPRYYRKYKNLQIRHIEALEKITELENKLERWKYIAKNLRTFNNFELPSENFNDKPDADRNGFDRGKRSIWNWKNTLRTSSHLNMRKATTDLKDYDKAHRSVINPSKRIFRTLSNKIGKSTTSLITRKRQPSGPITSEMISSPTDLRHTFHIIDSERDYDSNSINTNEFTRNNSLPIIHRTSSEPTQDIKQMGGIEIIIDDQNTQSNK